MILYSLISNRGGMLRVVESLEEVFRYLPENFPLKIIIMGEDQPFETEDKRFIFFQTDDVSTPNASRKSLVTIRKQIFEMFKDQHIDWLIADFMTLPCFKDLNVKICYDVHFLGRPFFEAFSRQKKMEIINDFTNQALTLALDLQHLSFIKFEAGLMAKAQRFIVNSQSTRKSLEKDYKDVIEGKLIEYIPVSTNLEVEVKEKEITYRDGFYFHARFHPQKGIHFLLNLDWNGLGLTMRGFEKTILNEKNNAYLASRSILGLPWTNDSAAIRAELLTHEFVLFPSIYEPWGLSLQEALALGKICIANRCESGHEEQIVDGVNGFLVDFAASNILEKLKEIKGMSSENKARISMNAKKSAQLGHDKRNQMLANYLMRLKLLPV